MEDNAILKLELLDWAADLAMLKCRNDLELMLSQGECSDCQYDVAQCYCEGYCKFLAR